MKLLNFDIKNCFSYRDAHLDLDGQGLKLVTGFSYDEDNENGSGKSSLVSKSLCWWLYGRTPEGLKTDEVVNVHVKPTGKRKKVNAQIKGRFLGSDGSEYELLRSRNPNKLVLRCEGNDISGTSVTATQARVDAVLGRDYNTFIQADLFGQGKQAQFFGLTPTEQRKVVESLLPIQEKVESALTMAKEKNKEVTAQRMAIREEEVLSAQKLKLLSEQATELRLSTQEWSRTHEQNRLRLADKINKEAERVAALAPHIKIAKENLAKAEAEMPETKSFDEGIAEANEWKSKYSNFTARYRTEILECEKEIARREMVVNKWSNGFNCPSCRQQLPPDQYQELQSEIMHKKNELTSWQNSLVRATTQLTQTEEYINKCDEQLTKLLNAKGNIGKLMVQQASSKAALNALTTKAQDGSQFFKEELALLDSAVNPFTQRAVDTALAVSEEQEHHDLIEDKRHKWESEERNLGYWKIAFSKTLPLKLIEEAVGALNESTNNHLQNLQAQQLHVYLSLVEGDNEELKLNSEVFSDTGGRSYAALSGGEKQIVNFAAGLALADLADSQVAGSSSVMILDEPFENLSARNADCVVTYLQEIMSTKSSVFLISHSDSLKGLIPNQIHVIKQNGISEVHN